MRKCEMCGVELPVKPGRPPKYCPNCREKAEAATPTEIQQPSTKIEIPVLKKLTSTKGIKKGQILYQKHPLFDDEVSKLRWAPDYKVLSVTDNDITVIRNKTAPYKLFPATQSHDKFYKKIGTTRVDENDKYLTEV